MRIKSLLDIRFLCAMAALSAGAYAQAKKGSQAARQCTIITSCNAPAAPRDCTPKRDDRSCTRSISILGIAAATMNDPVCEAAKAAQNQTYQVQAQACEARKADDKAENEWKRQQCVAVADACSATFALAESTKFVGARVLWVDDHPDNNTYERQALVELGATIATVTDTDQAVAQLTRQGELFDTIISDFARTNDPKAGYTLLALVRKLADPPPLVIYSGSYTPTFAAEAIKRGAFGETNQPKELMSLVIRSAVSHRQQRHKRAAPK